MWRNQLISPLNLILFPTQRYLHCKIAFLNADKGIQKHQNLPFLPCHFINFNHWQVAKVGPHTYTFNIIDSEVITQKQIPCTLILSTKFSNIIELSSVVSSYTTLIITIKFMNCYHMNILDKTWYFLKIRFRVDNHEINWYQLKVLGLNM